LGYRDGIHLAYILPLPSGPVVVSVTVSTPERALWEVDLQKFCDHLHASYDGTLEEWRAFLTHRGTVPYFLEDMRFTWADSAKAVAAHVGDLSFAADAQVLTLSPSSRLMLTFAWYRSFQGVTYGVDFLRLSASADEYVVFQKQFKPDPQKGQQYTQAWERTQTRALDGESLTFKSNSGTAEIWYSAASTSDILYRLILRTSEASSEEDLHARWTALRKSVLVGR
jgi:hypothetical protein